MRWLRDRVVVDGSGADVVINGRGGQSVLHKLSDEVRAKSVAPHAAGDDN
jgi:hypothetical protein